jgi:hypothetical protein
MSRLTEIQSAIIRLDAEEQRQLARWLGEELSAHQLTRDDAAPDQFEVSRTSIGSLPEQSLVCLKREFPDDGVRSGEKGTIVHVYKDGGYDVEVSSDRAKPIVITVENNDVELAPQA